MTLLNTLLRNISETWKALLALGAVAVLASAGTAVTIRYVGVPESVDNIALEIAAMQVTLTDLGHKVRRNTEATDRNASGIEVLVEISIEQASDLRFLTCMRRKEDVEGCTEEVRRTRDRLRKRFDEVSDE